MGEGLFMADKSPISEHEAEELLKASGYTASVVVHDNGLVVATAISGDIRNPHLQSDVDEELRKIQRKHRIEKRPIVFRR
jgi:hypothetical protein